MDALLIIFLGLFVLFIVALKYEGAKHVLKYILNVCCALLLIALVYYIYLVLNPFFHIGYVMLHV